MKILFGNCLFKCQLDYIIFIQKKIHRDIKTLNIFLAKDLDAKLGDLGVTKIL
mgnify:CR=1 FL=1